MSPATTGERYWRDRALQAEERITAAKGELVKVKHHPSCCPDSRQPIPFDACTCGLVPVWRALTGGHV